MLWANFLTPPQRKYDLTNLDDLTIINYDCEAPGSNGSAAIENCGRITVFGTTGTNKTGPVFSGGARQVWLHGSFMDQLPAPGQHRVRCEGPKAQPDDVR